MTGKTFDQVNHAQIPEAVVIAWDAAHGAELCVKDLLKEESGISFMVAQEARVTTQTRIFSSGRAKALLKDECQLHDNVRYYELTKVSETRWIAPRINSYQNALNTLPQQIELLLAEGNQYLRTANTTKKQKHLYAVLADELGNSINLPLHFFSLSVLRILKKFSLRRQDKDRAGYLLWPDAEEVHKELLKLQDDLRSSTDIKKQFANCPEVLDHLEMFEGALGFYNFQTRDRDNPTKQITLNNTEPTWKSTTLWTWTNEEQNKEKSEVYPHLKDILSPLELDSIKNFKPVLEVKKPSTRNPERDTINFEITSNASHLVQKLIHSWKIRVLDRVPKIFKLKFDAFYWYRQFDTFLCYGKDAFCRANERELRAYLKSENDFFQLRDELLFEEDKVIEEMLIVKEFLCSVIPTQVEQLKQMKILRQLISSDDPEKKSQRADNKRVLSKLESTSWFKFLPEEDGLYELVELRVVAFLRNSPILLGADVQNYIRALTRGTVSSSAETVVEQLFSIAKQQNRDNLDWKKLLVELQFRTLGPKRHEEEALKVKLYKKLKSIKRMRATVQDPERRKTRSPHIVHSKTIDRQLAVKAKYRGLC